MTVLPIDPNLSFTASDLGPILGLVDPVSQLPTIGADDPSILEVLISPSITDISAFPTFNPFTIAPSATQGIGLVNGTISGGGLGSSFITLTVGDIVEQELLNGIFVSGNDPSFPV